MKTLKRIRLETRTQAETEVDAATAAAPDERAGVVIGGEPEARTTADGLGAS